MSKFLVLGAVFLSFSAAHAADECPAGTTLVSACVADAIIPVLPFISICSEGRNYSMVVNSGSMQHLDVVAVQRTVTETSDTFIVVDQSSGYESFTIMHGLTGSKVKAKLNYQVVGEEFAPTYKCSALVTKLTI